jgi:hypothetical protein
LKEKNQGRKKQENLHLGQKDNLNLKEYFEKNISIDSIYILV